MKYASKTEIGHRAHNEDSLLLPTGEETYPFIAVADGMGGHLAGDVASALVIEGMKDAMGDLRDGDLLGQLKRAIQRVNVSVYRAAQSDPARRGMGSTLVCALLDRKRYIVANVGDSRLYHFDGTGIEQMTRDHTLVQMLVDHGEISREEARVHPRRNLITRAIGIGIRTEVDLFDCEWILGDILLLCSDGLCGSVTDEEMAGILRQSISLAEMCDQLVDLALANGSTDNITVALARCEGGDCA